MNLFATAKGRGCHDESSAGWSVQGLLVSVAYRASHETSELEVKQYLHRIRILKARHRLMFFLQARLLDI